MSFGTRRVALALLLMIVTGGMTLATTRPASAAENGPIATEALRHVGEHGGQCWTFMKQVVATATGRSVGFDYRAGYFEAGAVEVSASEATNGDIIQIADDGNSGPWASYPGLHTAIVLENRGGGVFDAIDSNQNWDEMVRLRPAYNPYAAAERYGLDVHIYRIPGGSTADAPATPASTTTTTTNWAAGDSAKVAADATCLNVRSSASLSGAIKECVKTGVELHVLSSAVAADGYSWVQVQTANGTGWAATRYLMQTAAAVSAAAAPEPPAAETPPVETTTPDTTAANPTAKVDNSPGCLRLRSAATTSGGILDCLSAGTSVELLGDDAVSADGYSWVNVRVRGKTGWLASEFLIQ